MAEITRFIINKASNELQVELYNDESIQLSFEYLRVFSPAQNPKELVSHKKSVALVLIESVGKHGYRLTFDDDHNAIFGADDFISLASNFENNWKSYLEKINQSAHSREAMINFTEVK